jgi:hypothetical protein
LIQSLRAHRNWYLDLANEHDVGDDRHVPVSELSLLRQRARDLAPHLLITASFGGHDLTRDDLRDALLTARLDFLCPHRPRTPGSCAQTENQTRSTLGLMQQLGVSAPIHYQEPFRRGYDNWQPAAADFLADLRGAIAADAAGWCFHNGQQRDTPGHEPRRSFDLRAHRLFDQLDPAERQFIDQARTLLAPSR